MTQTYHHALPVGSRIEHFEIQAVLGAGGFGITYKAWDTRLEATVAIKEYLPNELAMRTADGSTVLPRASGDKQGFAYGLKRFLDEARTLAKFKEPNIVRVTHFMEANDTAYLVMDYEAGETLSEYLRHKKKPLSEAEIKAIIIPILDGLRAVHDQNFLHRDIKPSNIYLRKDGAPMLIDFGAARLALGQHSRSLTGVVTAGYAPFEQYSSHGKQGPWTDLYGIGATLYRGVTGQPPVDAPARIAAVQDGEADPLPPASQAGGQRYSAPFLAAIDWMLRPSPKDRPQSVAEVLAVLLGKTVPASGKAVAKGGGKRQGVGKKTRKPAKPVQIPSFFAAHGNQIVFILAGLGLIAGLVWWLPVQQKTQPAQTFSGKETGGKTVPAQEGKKQVQRKLAGMKEARLAQIRKLLQEAKDLASKGNFKKAEALLRTAKALQPDNTAIRQTQKQIQQQKLASEKEKLRLTELDKKRKEEERLAEEERRRKEKVRKEAAARFRPGGVFRDTLKDGTKGPTMVVVPPGAFMMGKSEAGFIFSASAGHKVTIAKPYAIGKYEVTFDEYDKFTAATGRKRKSDHGWGRGKHPVIKVKWKDAVAYTNWLSELTGKRYRLPSDAEWEYAARGGTSTKFWWGDKDSPNYMNYGKGVPGFFPTPFTEGKDTWTHTAPVGSFPANPFGLHDTSGNVWEIVEDCWHASGRFAEAPTDGSAWMDEDCGPRTIRGGSWGYGPFLTQSASRAELSLQVKMFLYSGFRVARDLTTEELR